MPDMDFVNLICCEEDDPGLCFICVIPNGVSQQHSGKDRNNGNYNKKFNQCEDPFVRIFNFWYPFSCYEGN